MKITEVTTKRFKYTTHTTTDSDGHGHPGPPREAVQIVLQIHTDEGVSGHWFGVNDKIIDGVIAPALVGKDPFMREEICMILTNVSV